MSVWLTLLVGAAPLSAGRAQDAVRDSDARAPLRLEFEQALALLDQAPELRARTAAAQQLRAARREVGALASDAQISLEAGPRMSPEVHAQGRAGVSQAFALSALGDARREVLGTSAAAYESERNAERAARRMQTSDAWLQVHLAHRALEIARAELELARALSERTARAAALSELTRADAADAQAYAAEAQLSVLSAEGELTDARLELGRALAISEPLLDVRGAPPALAELPAGAVQAVRSRILAQPGLARIVRRSAQLAARERELRAAHAPQLSVGGALDRSDPGAWAALVTLGFSLPLQDRSRRERAELEAERRLLAGTLDEQRTELTLGLERVLHEIEHRREAVHYAESELLPAVEEGLTARETLFRAGEATVLEVILARRAALGLRLRHARLQTAWRAALARFRELARAAGVEG